jgi:hypothetical protein
MMRVDTEMWAGRNQGHQPSGRGSWFFAMETGNGQKMCWSHYGNWATAKADALKTARRYDRHVVVLQP